MKILFRVDGIPEFGMGHVVRCLALAKNLKSKLADIQILFYGSFDQASSTLLEENKIESINNPYEPDNEEESFSEIIKKIKPDNVFIDKLYNYSKKFIIKLRNHARIIMFHNLCDGAYYSHIFILPSAHTDESIITDPEWNNEYVSFYWGADYILINNDVQKAKAKALNDYKKGERLKVAITTGGSDPKGVLIKIANWLKDSGIKDADVFLLKGKAFMHSEELQKFKNLFPNNIKTLPFNYETLAKCDIAVSTFGVSTYELIYLGIPTISIGHAINNAKGSANLYNKYKAIIDLGLIDKLEKETFVSTLKELINNVSKRIQLKKNAIQLIDGNGLNRITNLVLNN